MTRQGAHRGQDRRPSVRACGLTFVTLLAILWLEKTNCNFRSFFHPFR